MKTQRAIIASFTVGALSLLLLCTAPADAQETAEELYQTGLYQEEVQGNLQGAIRLYERILADFPSNRPMAANALMHIGLCHEKRGSQEAQRAYRRLLREYADQISVAERARVRLASLQGLTRAQPTPATAPVGGIVVRNLTSRDYGVNLDATGAPSPDGRYLASLDWGSTASNIGVLDLVTKEYRLLTDHPDMEQGMALSADFSPDSNTIAYAWLNSDGSYEVRLAFRNGAPPRTLCADSAYWFWPDTWSHDGYRLIVERGPLGGEGAVETGWVSLADGSFLTFDRTQRGQPVRQRWSLSPDGGYLAFDFDVAEDSNRRDISMIPADGGVALPIIEHPANDRVAGWLPGSDALLFVSDRSGTMDLYAVEVADGAIKAPPRIVRPEVGPMEPMGFTRDGDLFYWIRILRMFVNVAPFDPETGLVEEEASEPLLGWKADPDWSPDGRYLTYWNKKDRPTHAASWDQVLGVTDLGTGEERELVPRLEIVKPRWSPDGQSILVLGLERDRAETEAPAAFSIDPETGEATELLRFAPQPQWSGRLGVTQAPNGRDLVYVREGRMVLHNVSSGEEAELYRHPGLTAEILEPSPDGRHLVFAVVDSSTWSGINSEGTPRILANGYGKLMLMSVPGGEMEELLAIGPGTSIRDVDWGPEGRFVYFLETGPDQPRALKRVSVDGGEAEVVWAPAMGWFALSPVGNRIAFTTYEHRADVYIMENLKAALQEMREGR